MSFREISNKVMSGERINNINLRVCFYARVSTDSDTQLNSLENQLEYYKNYIKLNPNWTYIDGYIDEGISGVRVEKRESFKRMIRDAKQHKFDLIITKEVSRFARDLEDSIHYIRELKDANVGVFFENQNLNTFDSNSELILNIMFNLAQEESKKLSSRIKFGHKQAIENGHVLGSSNITGYKKENCKLIIDPEEAKFIIRLYELYATGEYGLYKLSKILGKLGYYNKKGNIYDKDSLKRMIENPKYKGYYRGKTTEIIDYRTKQRKKIEEKNQVMYKSSEEIIPAIVSEELWDKANKILKSRTKNHLNTNHSGGHKYALSSKLYCKYHNHNYQRSHGSRKKNRPTWSCGLYLKYNLDICSSPIIAEKDILNILNNVYKELNIDKSKIMSNMLDIYKSIDKNEYKEDIENIKNNITNIENKKTLLVDMVINNELTKEELKNQFKTYNEELDKLNKKLVFLETQSKLMNNNNFFHNIKDNIQKELNGDILDQFIRKFVDEIIVSKIDNDRNNIKMDIYLNMSGEEKIKIKGARHIEGVTNEDTLYLENQHCSSIETLRKDRKTNYFTFNVYI